MYATRPWPFASGAAPREKKNQDQTNMKRSLEGYGTEK